MLSKSDRELVGAGDVPLMTLGCAVMNRTLAETVIKERVYVEGEHTTDLKEGATPFCLTTPRRVPLPLMKKVQEEIKRMEQLDVIEPIHEPTEWCSPTVVVPKADDSFDDTESSDSDDSSSDYSGFVEEPFEVMFVPEEELQQVN